MKVNISDNESDVLSAEIISVSKKYDIAILKIEDGKYFYGELDIDRNLPDLGEEIAIYGYPFGKRMNDNVMDLNISMAKGYVSSNQRIDGIDKSLLDISAKSGNSGSPIISLENGRVIGILSGSIVSGSSIKEEVNYMIPIKHLNEIIN